MWSKNSNHIKCGYITVLGLVLLHSPIPFCYWLWFGALWWWLTSIIIPDPEAFWDFQNRASPGLLVTLLSISSRKIKPYYWEHRDQNFSSCFLRSCLYFLASSTQTPYAKIRTLSCSIWERGLGRGQEPIKFTLLWDTLSWGFTVYIYISHLK